MRKITGFIVLVMTLLVLSRTDSDACVCGKYTFDLNNLYKKSDIAIVALSSTTLNEVTVINGVDYKVTEFRILEIYKGSKRDGVKKNLELNIYTKVDDCEVEFDKNKKYIIYANDVKGVGYRTSICSGSVELKISQGHYYYLKRLISKRKPIRCGKRKILSNYPARAEADPAVRCWSLKTEYWSRKAFLLDPSGKVIKRFSGPD